jgi:HlyD family secretion protein
LQSKIGKPVLLGLGLIVLLIVGFGAVKLRGQSTAAVQQTVRTVQASRGPIEVAISGSGNVAFAEDVRVKAQAAGKVQQVLVKDGEQVEAGQSLFVLENPALELQRDQARSSVEKLTQELRDLEEELGALQVVATEAGRVTNVTVSEGDQVTKGAVLVTLVDDDTFSATVPFLRPQRDQIAVGQTAQVFLPEFLSSLSGKVVKVASSGQAGVGGTIVYPVTVEFANPGALVDGVQASVTVETEQGSVEALETGTAGPKKLADIRSAAVGRVKAIYIEVGDKVKAGQTLIELENDDLPYQLNQKRDSLSQAQLNLATQDDQLARLVVTAPISGIFREVESSTSSDGTVLGPVQVGDELKVNDLLGRIVNNSSYQVVVRVDELDIGQIALGQKAEITVEALPGRILPGTVTAIAEEGTVQSGAAVFPVTLTLDPVPGLRAGMTATARILVASKKDALLLPIEAVQELRGRFFVMVPSAAEPTRRSGNRVEIEVGLHNENYVEVVSGLNEGDVVLVPQKSTVTGSESNRPGRVMMPGGPPPGGGGGFRFQVR